MTRYWTTLTINMNLVRVKTEQALLLRTHSRIQLVVNGHLAQGFNLV